MKLEKGLTYETKIHGTVKVLGEDKQKGYWKCLTPYGVKIISISMFNLKKIQDDLHRIRING